MSYCIHILYLCFIAYMLLPHTLWTENVIQPPIQGKLHALLCPCTLFCQNLLCLGVYISCSCPLCYIYTAIPTHPLDRICLWLMLAPRYIMENTIMPQPKKRNKQNTNDPNSLCKYMYINICTSHVLQSIYFSKKNCI